ncbi:hypothetical protein [Methanospirillum lacunae]|uniref:Uncharacterized protein n=1 Tax=Methanospirillum lacunae TaxID=668570 RepID=A0A2V2MX34_9EURY|nr:hypothetical protein [Methanospirillum lacunae]PWR69966.1 hypothetical protein DK846_16175 [Methanospirillum lacunae]
MIRTVAILLCTVMLFTVATADETNNTSNSTTSGISNLTNIMTANQNTTNQASVQATPTATVKPVYKESVGSVYEADYQEPQPMTFTSYPTC